MPTIRGVSPAPELDARALEARLAAATTVAAAARALVGDAAAAALARRVDELTGPRPGRLAIHAARIAAQASSEHVENATLDAVRDLTRLDTALLARLTPDGALVVRRAEGPLAAALAHADLEALAGGRGRVPGARCVLAAPLAVAGQPCGLVVAAGAYERPPARDLLELLAAHAATALAVSEALSADAAATAQAAAESRRHDPLTGLPGPAAFATALTTPPRALDRHAPNRAVVLVDVEGFHDLACERGRQAADRLLRELTSALVHTLRSGDELFRVGGDELAAAIAIDEEVEAIDAARRLRDAAAAHLPRAAITAGVVLPRRGEEAGAVLARARAAQRSRGVRLA